MIMYLHEDLIKLMIMYLHEDLIKLMIMFRRLVVLIDADCVVCKIRTECGILTVFKALNVESEINSLRFNVRAENETRQEVDVQRNI